MITRRKFMSGAALGMASALCPISVLGNEMQIFGDITRDKRASGGDSSATTDLYTPSANVFFCPFSNVSGGGDDTGAGFGLSGADLTLEDSGTVAGATGSPPSRVLNGSNDYFSFYTWAAINSLVNQDVWGICVKMQYHTSTNALFDVYRVAGGSFSARESSGKFRFIVDDSAQSRKLDSTPSDAIPLDTDIYVYMWNDNVNNVRAGWSTTFQTAWSGFDANKRCEGSAQVKWTTDFNSQPWIGRTGFGYVTGKLYYVALFKGASPIS